MMKAFVERLRLRVVACILLVASGLWALVFAFVHLVAHFFNIPHPW